MCGIAGILSHKGNLIESDLLSMYDGISHRGPDGKGFFIHGPSGLLHTRLSIIDTSENANQPLYNEDKTLVLICNGEIYNHLALRQELELKGHRFHCHSDSEVLLHLYEEFKDQPTLMLNKLKGMFAFAIYDTTRQVFFLARDRFGIKPLYYANDRQAFYFASELNSIVGIRPDLKDDIDYTSLYEYYQFLSIPEPNTIYEKVKAFPAGHFGIVKQNTFSITPWYTLEGTAIPDKYSDGKTFSQELFKKMEVVVKEHLLSDVPLGSFLSAGIDSTTITHFASLHCNRSFTSISAGFPNYPEDESAIASETAAKMGVRHQVYTLKASFFDDTESIIQYFDQPFAVSSAFSLYRISKLARNEMKVVLTGDGGDEVFAGYDYKYKAFYIPGLVRNTPQFLRPILNKIFGWLPVKKLNQISKQYALSPAHRFLNRCRVISSREALGFIPSDKRSRVEETRLERYVDQLFGKASKFSSLHQLLYVDFHTFLKSEMLYKVDRMTMANRLEGRVPFLDHEIVEMAFSASANLLRDHQAGKLPLRQWVDEHYPGLGSRPKTGFNTPLEKLLKEDEASRKLVTGFISNLRNSGLVNNESMEMIIHRVELNVINVNHVMLLVCLAGWVKNCTRR
jgi:asparagine synthase (glutamine-hydrolysing)